ncbi:MAG: hypothetical protein IH987_00440 [Planctomycetes bacterium]|nr:hypothetical protein [Planctomycetota bacterium]
MSAPEQQRRTTIAHERQWHTHTQEGQTANAYEAQIVRATKIDHKRLV